MTEQEVNNLIDSKIAKTKMSQLPEATQTSGLYSIGYNGNQSVKYKANLLQGDPLTVRKTYQTEAEALADKNPIDTATSLPLKVGQFVSIVDDGEKNGIYRISSISGDGTMSLELQGKLGDLSGYANHGYESNPKTLKEVDDEKANHGYASIEVAKTLKQVEDNASVKIKNEVVNGNFENGLIEPFSKADGGGGASTLNINSSTPISGSYDIRLTITTPATNEIRPMFYGLHRAGNIGDKIYLHFYAKILSGVPAIGAIHDGGGVRPIYGGDVINGRNTRIINVGGTGNAGVIYFNSLSAWDMQMDNFIRINLTETFGAGNEPTEEEMNLLLDMAEISDIDDEIAIPAQKIMQWQQQKLEEVEDNASVKIENLVVNGDFRNKTTGWVINDGASLTVVDGVATYLPSQDGPQYLINNMAIKKGSIYYVSASINAAAQLRFTFGNGEAYASQRTEIQTSYNTPGVMSRSSTIISLGDTTNANTLLSRGTDGYSFKNVMCVNLTDTFGAGNEPTLEEMDLLISTLGIEYFEGEITISAQKVMQWMFKSHQQSANHGYSEEEEPKTLKEVDDDLAQHKLDYVEYVNKIKLPDYGAEVLTYPQRRARLKHVAQEYSDFIPMSTNSNIDGVPANLIGQDTSLPIVAGAVHHSYFALEYFAESDDLDRFRLDIRTDSTNYIRYEFYNTDKRIKQGLNYLILTPSDLFTYGTFDPNNITELRFVNTRIGGGGISFRVNNFHSYKMKAVVSIWFDDCHRTVLTRAKPIMDTHGIVGTQAVVGSRIGNSEGVMNQSELMQMMQGGWEHCNHTYLHEKMGSLPVERAELSIQKGLDYCNSMNFGKSSYFMVNPGGQRSLDESMEKKYCTVRRTGLGYNYFPIVDFHELRSLEPGWETPASEVINWIDKAVAEGLWIILLFHQVRPENLPASGRYPETEYETIMSYLASKRTSGDLSVLTCGQTISTL